MKTSVQILEKNQNRNTAALAVKPYSLRAWRGMSSQCSALDNNNNNNNLQPYRFKLSK